MPSTPNPYSAFAETANPAPISPVPDIVHALAEGKMVILVDEEDRENEGDLVLAADHVSPEAINFMAKFGRGLICLTLTREHCERLHLPPMTPRNGTVHSTAFTVSIEAAQGVTTGISAADRAHTIATAVAPHARASDLVQPGHIFPLQAVDGGVLMRAGHTEAGCDLARMAGCTPTAVICEIMNDDGSMARLPELQQFAAQHGLKIGTIADLIEYRSRTESLIQPVAQRPLCTAWGDFDLIAYRDLATSSLHLALRQGNWGENDPVLVRVHEPLSVLDVLERGRQAHSWSLEASLTHIAKQGQGIAVLLNCGESADALLQQLLTAPDKPPSQQKTQTPFDLRTYGVGAQILRANGVRRMHLLGQPRKMPSMAGYGLEVLDFVGTGTPKMR